MDHSTLELTLPAEWGAVRAAWDDCRGMLARAGLGQDESYALAMVAQELLENAVKYGAADADVRLSLRVEDDDVTVEVRSRVGGDDAHLRAFGGALQRLRESPDARDAYVDQLRRAVGRAPEAGGSELGLARIAYEGQCRLDFQVDGDVLAVYAVYRR
jgi:hypothetical protein